MTTETSTFRPADVAPATTSAGRRRWRRAGAVQWLAALALIAYVAALKAGADRWAWATVLAYGPRWPALLPMAVVLLGALLAKRRPWLTLAATIVAGVWLMDARVPTPRFGGDVAPVRLRVMTLNADGGNTAGRGTDLARIGRFIADANPDVICLQEWRMPGPPPLPPGTWNVRRERSEMIVTRLPVRAVTALPSSKLLGRSSVFGCKITVAPGRDVWVFTPHLETPRHGFDKVLDRAPDAWRILDDLTRQRQTVSERAVAWINETAADGDVLVAGDFNLVGDGRIFRSTWAAAFTDAFATAGWGAGGTKLQNGWRVRIDHVLTGPAWRATHCAPGPDVGSDHLPLVADVERLHE